MNMSAKNYLNLIVFDQLVASTSLAAEGVFVFETQCIAHSFFEASYVNSHYITVANVV